MKFKIQVVIEDEQADIRIEDIIQLEKQCHSGNTIGLTLSESKQLLKELQKIIVITQAEAYIDTHRNCQQCHEKRRAKGHQNIQFRTLFGIVTISSLRLYHCKCEDSSAKTFSLLKQWLPEHTSPELQYIETKWASLMSYGLTASLLKDVLPVSETTNSATIRNHLHKVAQRQEMALDGKSEYLSGCPREWRKLPKPSKPMTVGIDGGYLKNWHHKNTNFEIIAGKSFSKTQSSKRFGFVQRCDKKPRRRLMDVLTQQGMQANQQICFLSDGADNLRNLQINMYPESEHVLDWFHITMRLTVLNQFAKGLIKTDPEEGENITKYLKSMKWYLWHGNVEKAFDKLNDCYLIDDKEIKYENKKKFLKYLFEMKTYIQNNQYMIPNYGEKYRYGETISTGFVESTINEVVAKRMVKKQQMQWSHQGAHYLIQTRTAVLNDDLKKTFEEWYPDLKLQECGERKTAKLKIAA